MTDQRSPGPPQVTDATPLADAPEEIARNIFAAAQPPDPSKRKESRKERNRPRRKNPSLVLSRTGGHRSTQRRKLPSDTGTTDSRRIRVSFR